MTKNKLLTPREIIEYAMRVDQIGSTLNENLLLEELDQEVALKISQGNDALISMLDELNKAFSGKVPAVDKEIEKLRTSADKSATILKKLVKGSNSKLGSEKLLAKISSFFKGKFDPKAAMNAILLLQSRAQELVEILKYSMPKIIKQLEAAGANNAEQRPMGKVLGANPSMVAKAIKDLLLKSKPGVFKSAGNFFKSLNVNKKIINVNDKVDYDTIAKEMAAMKVSDFYSVHEGTAKIKTDGGAKLKDVVKKASSSLKPTAKEGAPEATGEAAKSDPKKAVEKAKAVADAKPTSPKAGVKDALTNWHDGLTKTSKMALKKGGKMVKLKAAVEDGIDKSEAAVKRAVTKAIKTWRSEYEVSLIKSKHFAKKNFDSLQALIPDLVSSIMRKKAESAFVLTQEDIKKVVYHVLDQRVAQMSGLLYERIGKTNKPGESVRQLVQISKILKEIREADIRDARGNIVIEPGLKVRHKKSGLEYSVQDVNDEKGKTKIVLAVPEMPRVDITKTFPSVVTEKDSVDALDRIIDSAEQHQETIFVVDEKEFEKDYEVK